MSSAKPTVGASTETQTVGQLERMLSQRVNTLHKELLGKSANTVVCHCFQKNVFILLLDSQLSVEKNLIKWGYLHTARQIRQDIKQNVRALLSKLISEILQVSVISVLVDTDIESGITSIVAVLEKAPTARQSKNKVHKTLEVKE